MIRVKISKVMSTSESGNQWKKEEISAVLISAENVSRGELGIL